MAIHLRMYSCLYKKTWCMLSVNRPKYSYTLRSVQRLPDISSINELLWYLHLQNIWVYFALQWIIWCMTPLLVWLSGLLVTYSDFIAILLCNALYTLQSHLTSQWLGLSHEMIERFANVAEMTDIHNRFLSQAQQMTCAFVDVEALGPSLPLSLGG